MLNKYFDSDSIETTGTIETTNTTNTTEIL